MDRPPIFAPAALLAATIGWTLTVAFGEPTIGRTAAAVAAADLLIMAVVAIVGMVLARRRWARRFALVVISFMIPMALTMPISNRWIMALLLSGLAVAAVTGPSLDGYLHTSTPGGPPPRAVALPLVLITFPALTALTVGSPLSFSAWSLIVAAPVTAWLYGKGRALGLWLARVLIPIVVVAVAVPLVPWAIAVMGAMLSVEIWLAWTGQAALALEGQAAPPKSVAIPPELAPREILEAAGLDDRGRPTRRPSEGGSDS